MAHAHDRPRAILRREALSLLDGVELTEPPVAGVIAELSK
jgi:hypothetical protein